MLSRFSRGPSRQSVTIALLLINAAAILTVFFSLQQLYDRHIHEAEIRSQNLVLAIDLGLSHEIEKIDLSLQTVIASLGPRSSVSQQTIPASVKTLIRQQKAALPETEGWSIIDAKGTLVFHDSADPETFFSVADRDYFKSLQAGEPDTLLVSHPLNSRLTGERVLVLARAIRSTDGKFAGLVAAPLPTAYLKHFLSGFEVGPNGALTLRDKNLTVITRTLGNRQEAERVGDLTRVSSEFSRLIAAGTTHATYHGTMPFDQIERIASYRLISNAPIYAIVAIAKRDFLISWRNMAWRFLGFLGLFLLITNGAASLLIRQWQQLQRDACDLRASNEELEASVRHLQDRDSALVAAQEAGGLGTYSLDIPGGNWSCSEKLEQIMGIDTLYPHTIEGWQQLIHEDDRAPMSHYFFTEVIGKHQIFDHDYRLVRPEDGKTVWVHGLGKLDFDEHGQPIRMRGTIRDISDRKFVEERLLLTREIFHSTTEGILVTDSTGTIVETNPAFTTITGYSNEEAIGQNPRLFQSGTHDRKFYRQMWKALLTKGAWEGELTNRRKDGELYIQRSRIVALRDPQGKITRYTAVISDITALKETQRQLEHMAYYDELTGLPNRVLLTDRMHQAMAHCRRKKQALLGVCYLDLDGFKAVNDQWGHAVGDQLLVEVAKRLKNCTRAGDTVARLGGDEFVVLFCDLTHETEVEPTVARLMDSVSEPYDLNVGTKITLSIGITLYPYDTADEPDALIRHADQAMYEAKRSGKNRMRIFDPEFDRRLRDSQQTHDRLVDALANAELRLYYQPKVDLRSGAVVGAEALIRWQHPELGLLQPSQFLPAIEATELTFPIGEWILHEALQQQQRWQEQQIHLQISVNIFGLHLQRADFAERLATILAAYPNLAPDGLGLEILETTALEDLHEITQRIHDCSRLGVRFLLDDFGTGYSSLSYLRQLPVAHVKIDRSFVRDMLDNSEDQALVQGIVSMAHALQRKVIAEGVETIEHGAQLLRCGCDLAQGYGIARPMPAEAFPDWMTQWEMPAAWKEALSDDVIYFGKSLA